MKNKIKCYCCRCGATFYIDENEEENIVCPDCGCEYSEENNYIEVYS